MMQNRATVNMEGLYGLSNGAIFNDVEQCLTQSSRSRHYLTQNTLETEQDTDRYNEMLIGT